MSDYDYIRRAYGVDPVPGRKVIFTEYRERPEGTILPEDRGRSHYVMVQFPNVTWPAPCHPRSLEYLPPVVPLDLGGAVIGLQEQPDGSIRIVP